MITSYFGPGHPLGIDIGQSFGMPIARTGLEVWRQVAHDLTERCVPLSSVRS